MIHVYLDEENKIFIQSYSQNLDLSDYEKLKRILDDTQLSRKYPKHLFNLIIEFQNTVLVKDLNIINDMSYLIAGYETFYKNVYILNTKPEMKIFFELFVEKSNFEKVNHFYLENSKQLLKQSGYNINELKIEMLEM
jgi:hypothetical protein